MNKFRIYVIAAAVLGLIIGIVTNGYGACDTVAIQAVLVSKGKVVATPLDTTAILNKIVSQNKAVKTPLDTNAIVDKHVTQGKSVKTPLDTTAITDKVVSQGKAVKTPLDTNTILNKQVANGKAVKTPLDTAGVLTKQIVSMNLIQNPGITEPLAVSRDSTRPAYKKIYPAKEVRDSLGNLLYTIPPDTVTIPAGPVLSQWSDGVSTYAMATIVTPDSGLKIVWIRPQTGKVIDAQIVQPVTKKWLVSKRVTGTLYEGK